MAIQVVARVLEIEGLKPTQKFVLIVQANYADRDGGNAYPSVATICRVTGLKERSVRKALADLRAMGLISQEGRHHSGTKRYSISLTPASGAGASNAGASNAPPNLHQMHPAPARHAPNPSGNRQVEPLDKSTHFVRTLEKVPKKPGRETWLTPLGALWERRTGGTFEWGKAAKLLAPFRARVGDEALARALANYLAATEVEYCSLNRFSVTFGKWAGTAPLANKAEIADAQRKQEYADLLAKMKRERAEKAREKEIFG